jgi:hypothetical protein
VYTGLSWNPSLRCPAEAKPNLIQLCLSRLSLAKPTKLNSLKLWNLKYTSTTGTYTRPKRECKDRRPTLLHSKAIAPKRRIDLGIQLGLGNVIFCYKDKIGTTTPG